MKLQIGSQHTGMYGRRLVVFEPRKSVGPSVLPSNTFGPGETFCAKTAQFGVHNFISILLMKLNTITKPLTIEPLHILTEILFTIITCLCCVSR